MQIPKRFKLHGQTIEVCDNPRLAHKENFAGVAIYRENRIELQPTSEDFPIPPTHQEQTFCHELVHFLFYSAGYTEDAGDEAKVDRVANLLHQALTTMEYK